MSFNSHEFILFLPTVFILYWVLANRSLKFQNGLLLLASYFFYAYSDWRFLLLLIFSTILDYYTGQKIQDSENKKVKKNWLWISVIINLGILCLFKYYNFFIDSFVNASNGLGIPVNVWTLNVILPIGISFYTFHGLSYVIDIYNNRIKPEYSFTDYAVFVSFFPLLVAGPIERAGHLLPQLKKQRTFEYPGAVDGLRQILWGFFKKIVIADNCAIYADQIFNNPTANPGSTLALGAVFFAFQIYGDFSGYSDIAIGTARLFGIELLQNFSFPYFSRDIAEFWRRWHISLSSWFKDYLYIPLGGSKGGLLMRIRNTFIIFIISGFWHGANWTFIFWGFLNAIFIMPSIIMKSNRNNLDIVAKGKLLPSLKELLSILTTFSLTVFAWIFFRTENMASAINLISEIFSPSFFYEPKFPSRLKVLIVAVLILFSLSIEWAGREKKYALAQLDQKWNRAMRWIFYSFIIFLIFMFMPSRTSPFIYFQF